MSVGRNRYGSMLAPEEAERRLQQQGARLTAPRRAVLRVLAGNRSHPSAEEIADQVRAKLGCVAPATVYNTLETLEKLGFVRRIEGLEARSHFDPDTSAHEHAICTKCRRVWDVAAVSPPRDLPEGFRVSDLLIQGVCKYCARPGAEAVDDSAK